MGSDDGASPRERVSEVLDAWARGESLAQRIVRAHGPASLPRATLEQEGDSTALAVNELIERLRLHGGAFGRYRVQGELGRGGMGVVLRVWDGELKRPLAMKLSLAAERAAEPESTARTIGRFLEEAQVTAQLSHPGIVPVHELGLDSLGRVYFTMRMVKGRSLGEVLALARESRDGWTQTRVLGLLLKACEALAYAHSRGVIHRDLKPANVMVGDFGEVLVMDWGLAKVLAQDGAPPPEPPIAESDASGVVSDLRQHATPDSPFASVEGHALGTPAYMAPEQARGELARLGPHSDVYAMGAILYELLAGRAPYAEPGRKLAPREIVARVLDGPPTPIVELGRGAPAELQAICARAMEREPERRYRDMGALLEDLRAFLDNRVVRAHRTGPVAELSKWVQRNRVFATASAVVVALLVASASGFAVVEARNRAAIEAERDKALREAEIADHTVDRFTSLIGTLTSVLRSPEARLQRVQELSRDISADTALDDDRRAQLLTTLGQALRDNGDFLAGKDVLLRAIEATRRVAPRDYGREYELLNALGLSEWRLGQLELAKQHMHDAIEASKLAGITWGDATARVYVNLTDVCIAANDLEGAQRYLDQLFEWLDSVGGRATPIGVASLNCLARIRNRQRRFAESAEALREAIATASAHLEPTNPDLLTMENNLAFALLGAGDVSTAREISASVVERGEGVLASDHTDLATWRETLCNALFRLGELGGLEEQHRAILAARRTRLGPNHVETLRALTNLASVLIRLDRWQEAAPFLDEAGAGFTEPGALATAEYVGFSRWLGELRWRQGRNEEAQTALRLVIERRGPAPEVLELLARVQFDAGELELAEASAQSALDETPAGDAQRAARASLLAEIQARQPPR